MARKNVFNIPLLLAQSLSATFTTPVTVVKYHDNIGYQMNVFATDSTGTFVLQGSNDYNQDEPTNTVTNPGTWTTIPLGGGTPTVNAANDSILIDVNQWPFNAIRLLYTPTIAGTGTTNIYLCVRQIGG